MRLKNTIRFKIFALVLINASTAQASKSDKICEQISEAINSTDDLTTKVKRLQKQRSNLNTWCQSWHAGESSETGTPLGIMAAMDNTEGLLNLLQAGAGVDVRDANGATALMRVRSKEAAELLLKHGANPNLRDRFGRTPLMYASPNLHHVAELLIKSKANPQIKDREGWSAWVYSEHVETDSLLTDNGLQPSPTDRLLKALRRASYDESKPDSDTVPAQKAISDGADVNAKWHSVPILLMIMLEHPSRFDLVALLVQSGAKVNVLIDAEPDQNNPKGIKGMNPLMLFLWETTQSGSVHPNRNWPATVKMFLKAGANVTHKDAQKRTAFSIFAFNSIGSAGCSEAYRETVASLLLAGADVNSQDEFGQNILHYVLDDCGYKGSYRPEKYQKTRLIEIVDIAIKSKVKVNQASKKGLRPLAMAKASLVSVDELSVSASISLETFPSTEEINQFKKDARAYYEKVVQLLIEAGARE